MTNFLLLFQGGFGALTGLLPMVLIIGVFYVLLIRPQQKRQRDLQATIAQLKAGDKIVTTGGVIGTITSVKDNSFLIRSAEKSILKVLFRCGGVDEEERKNCPSVRYRFCHEETEYAATRQLLAALTLVSSIWYGSAANRLKDSRVWNQNTTS